MQRGDCILCTRLWWESVIADCTCWHGQGERPLPAVKQANDPAPPGYSRAEKKDPMCVYLLVAEWISSTEHRSRLTPRAEKAEDMPMVSRDKLLIFVALLTGWTLAGTIWAEDQAQAQDLLSSMSRSPEPAVRMRAVEAWGDTASPAAVTHVVEALGDPELQVRQAAAQALSAMTGRPHAVTAPERAANYVLNALLQGPPETRAAVESVLPELRNVLEQRMAAVFTATQESSLRRQAAAFCLGRMGSSKQAEALAKETASADLDLARCCAEALFNLHDRRFTETWLGLAVHADAEIRARAVQALTELGGAAALGALARIAAGDSSGDLRLEDMAMESLNTWPERERIPVLIEVMRRNPRLKPAALERLRLITGLDLGSDPTPWQRWLEGRPPEPIRDQNGDVVPPFVPMPLKIPQ